MAEEKRERKQEGRSTPARKEESAIQPSEEWSWDSPAGLARRLHDEIDRLFSSFGPPAWRMPDFGFFRQTVPAVDVWETDEEVMVRADMPGVMPGDVEIFTTEDSLRLRAEIKQESEERERGFYKSERRRGVFERLIDLPADVRPDKAKATFKNGVLEVTLPKTEQAKERMKKIPVEVEEERPAGRKGGKTAGKKSARKT